MTKEQEYYAAGLADALQIIEETLKEELKIGDIYFVIMYENHTPYVEEMKLYRINDKSKRVYCFTKNIDCKHPTPDLVLTSEQSLKTRVFSSRQEAEMQCKYINI